MDHAYEHFELTPDKMGKDEWTTLLKEIGLEKAKRVDRIFMVDTRGEKLYVVREEDIDYDPQDIK